MKQKKNAEAQDKALLYLNDWKLEESIKLSAKFFNYSVDLYEAHFYPGSKFWIVQVNDLFEFTCCCFILLEYYTSREKFTNARKFQ
jgi:hypothetical protein